MNMSAWRSLAKVEMDFWTRSPIRRRRRRSLSKPSDATATRAKKQAFPFDLNSRRGIRPRCGLRPRWLLPVDLTSRASPSEVAAHKGSG